jgi:hypothetical protein
MEEFYFPQPESFKTQPRGDLWLALGNCLCTTIGATMFSIRISIKEKGSLSNKPDA